MTYDSSACTTVGQLNLLLAYMETNALNIHFSQIINSYVVHTISHNILCMQKYTVTSNRFIFQEF